MYAKNVHSLKTDLERLSERMISYCETTGLVLNNDKTQFLVSPKQECHVKVGKSLISPASEFNILGVDFDSNFTTLPYLHKLARAAKTRAALIFRLSYSMPPQVLSTLAKDI